MPPSSKTRGPPRRPGSDEAALGALGGLGTGRPYAAHPPRRRAQTSSDVHSAGGNAGSERARPLSTNNVTRRGRAGSEIYGRDDDGGRRSQYTAALEHLDGDGRRKNGHRGPAINVPDPRAVGAKYPAELSYVELANLHGVKTTPRRGTGLRRDGKVRWWRELVRTQ